MADLISREAVIDKAEYDSNFRLLFVPVGAIEAVPSVDAVEVVRCFECAIPHNKWTGCPKLGGLVTPPDFYCAYGERKEDNGR